MEVGCLLRLLAPDRNNLPKALQIIFKNKYGDRRKALRCLQDATMFCFLNPMWVRDHDFRVCSDVLLYIIKN